eukprot:CAMPEP_0179055560 /NCGR_PEP_ID=MMETSP0796-20121207/23365_1 /TAXON_ID=73915 /ORGANISM="Pyrodinium bahamense, Strain pbaha01" /LENGTH=253 /DNA_ID=CAMNT_0020752219 /DNA_START=145 /DNA_END=906 /DNA_ORIENTATION=+
MAARSTRANSVASWGAPTCESTCCTMALVVAGATTSGLGGLAEMGVVAKTSCPKQGMVGQGAGTAGGAMYGGVHGIGGGAPKRLSNARFQGDRRGRLFGGARAPAKLVEERQEEVQVLAHMHGIRARADPLCPGSSAAEGLLLGVLAEDHREDGLVREVLLRGVGEARLQLAPVRQQDVRRALDLASHAANLFAFFKQTSEAPAFRAASPKTSRLYAASCLWQRSQHQTIRHEQGGAEVVSTSGMLSAQNVSL